MLKKAGIAVAVATAGMLALTPMAFAGHKSDQDNHQQSIQGKPAGTNGTNTGSGSGAGQVCNQNVVIPPPSGNVGGTGKTTQGGKCTKSSTVVGQREKQHKSNDD